MYDLFEVIDQRDLPIASKLACVALLENLPDLIHVWEASGRSSAFSLTDENYEWDENMLTIYTDDGMINFVPLQQNSDVFAFIKTPMDGLVQDCLRA